MGVSEGECTQGTVRAESTSNSNETSLQRATLENQE